MKEPVPLLSHCAKMIAQISLRVVVRLQPPPPPPHTHKKKNNNNNDNNKQLCILGYPKCSKRRLLSDCANNPESWSESSMGALIVILL